MNLGGEHARPEQGTVNPGGPIVYVESKVLQTSVNPHGSIGAIQVKIGARTTLKGRLGA